MIYNIVTIDGTDYDKAEEIKVNKVVSTYNSTSTFSIRLKNYNGQYSSTFNLNNDVVIKADLDTNPATTSIFRGIIENINFRGQEQSEYIVIDGRDYGAVLQDIICSPRIFKNTEAGEIIKSLMRQNAYDTGITFVNVDTTITTIDRITFNGVSLYDAFQKVAEVAGYYFYIDEDKDLNFKPKDDVSSGETFNNTNITYSSFETSDNDIFNEVKILGGRQQTFAQEEFITGTDNTGSVYTLSAKPYNAKVQLSGATNTLYQPGGIIFIDDPATDTSKYLVDFSNQEIVLTSGTTAGDNTVPAGSIIIVDYFRSTPLIKTLKDNTSIAAYGLKKKEITDKNIIDLDEAIDVATTFIADHKDPIVEGDLSIRNIINITPGKTCVIDIPFHNQNTETYSIISASYIINPQSSLRDEVLSIVVNKKVSNFIDIFKQHELRLRSLEVSEVESSITNVELYTGSIGISGTATIIQRNIGSAFYFGVTGHNILNSPSSLLGDMRLGSTVSIL